MHVTGEFEKTRLYATGAVGVTGIKPCFVVDVAAWTILACGGVSSYAVRSAFRIIADPVLGFGLCFDRRRFVEVFFFFEVDFFPVAVYYLVLQIGERFVRQHLELATEVELPAAIERNETFFDICIDKGVDVDYKVFLFEFVDKIGDFFFESVGEQQ